MATRSSGTLPGSRTDGHPHYRNPRTVCTTRKHLLWKLTMVSSAGFSETRWTLAVYQHGSSGAHPLQVQRSMMLPRSPSPHAPYWRSTTESTKHTMATRCMVVLLLEGDGLDELQVHSRSRFRTDIVDPSSRARQMGPIRFSCHRI